MSNGMGRRALLEEQKEYYRARAAEYDAWFYREGRYDYGPELNLQWSREADEARDSLVAMGPIEHGLELACGTGIWTEVLARIAQRVTALDSSSEMLTLNASKLNARHVRYGQVDLFDWKSEEEADVVVIAFFLSHVPAERLGPFLEQVRRAVKPGGQLFVVDSRSEPSAAAHSGPTRVNETPVQQRRLADGREFHIVKIYYEPAELEMALRSAGFEPHVKQTAHYFIYAAAQG